MKFLKKIVHFFFLNLKIFNFFKFILGNKVYYLFSLVITNEPFFFLKDFENSILIGVYKIDLVNNYAKYLRNNGHVNVFEISRKNIDRLKSQNFNNNVRFFNYGLAEKESTLTFQEAVKERDQGYNKIISENIRSKSMENRKAQYLKTKANCKNIISIIEKTKQKIKFISLTCNGAEIYVFEEIELLR